jgi:hypothetical protein
MADKVCLLYACRIHPCHYAGCYTVQDEAVTYMPHRSEAGQIQQVDLVVLCEGGNVAHPPARGTGQSVNQDERFPFTGNLIRDFEVPNLNMPLADVDM